MDKSIPLSGQIYMLGIRPGKGGIFSSVSQAMGYLLTGAILLELYQNENIYIKNKRVFVCNPYSKNRLHLFAIHKLKSNKKPRKVAGCVNRLKFSMRHIRQAVQDNLVRKRVIRLEQKQFLFFRWKKPVLSDKSSLDHLISEIKEMVAAEKAPGDKIVLLSLLQHGGLLRRLYPDRTARKHAKKQLTKMMVNNDVSNAAAQAITAAQAVAASVAVSAVVAASTNS